MKIKLNDIVYKIVNGNLIQIHDKYISKVYTKILSEIFEGITIEESIEKYENKIN